MLTTNTTILREAIGQLERGRRAMMAAPEGKFAWEIVGRPECGSPGCCWGWMRAKTPTLHCQHIDCKGDFQQWADRLNLNTAWRDIVFLMGSEPGSLKIDMRISDLMDTMCFHYDPPTQRNNANRMMKLLITRLRHRLAVCEVEQGEWGRQLPAVKMPVGKARDQAVQEKLEVCCA